MSTQHNMAHGSNMPTVSSPINKLGPDHFSNIVNKICCFKHEDECTVPDIALVCKEFYQYSKPYMADGYKYYLLSNAFENLSMNWYAEKNREWESNILHSLCNKFFTQDRQIEMGLDFNSLEDFDTSIQWGTNYHADESWLDAIDSIMNGVDVTREEDAFITYWNREFKQTWISGTMQTWNYPIG